MSGLVEQTLINNLSLAEQAALLPGSWQSSFSKGMLAQLSVIGVGVCSPDGKYIYYPLDFNGRSDIYRLEIETGKQLQITGEIETGPQLSIAPKGLSLSPDGRWIVYFAGKDSKLWLIPSSGGKAVRLAEGEGYQSSPVFSPDGKMVAFVAGRGEKQDIAVVDVDPEGEAWPRRLSKGNHFVLDPHWLPDGKSLVYAEHDNQHLPYVETRLVQVTIETGENKVLKDGWNRNIQYQQPRPSPDGRFLAYVSDENGWANINLLDLLNGQSRPLRPENAEQSEPVWSPDGKQIAFVQNDNTSLHLYLVGLEGQERELDMSEGVINGVSWTPDGRKLFYNKQSPLNPSNIYFLEQDKGVGPIVLTANTIGGLEQAGLTKAEVVHWKSPDGLEIEGLLYLPQKIHPGKHPLLLHVHGGPISQYNQRWDGPVQYFVQRGWIVIEPNFRGSTGYGRVFRDKLNGSWGQEDMLDNIGAIEYLKERGLIDPGKVVAWGASGGGYATMLLLGKWPSLFKAGIALVGISNFVSFPEQTDRIARYLIQDLLGYRHENFSLYEERSPVTFAKDIKAPLLILMGASDARVPAKQGEEMVDALKAANKTEFEYVSYPGEGHAWRKTETILDYLDRMERFLEKYVLQR